MADETEKMAPTASIETVLVVRPLKVFALLLGFITVIIQILFIGASSWVGNDDRAREGLWEVCYVNASNLITECKMTEPKAWIMSCRALTILAMISCLAACIVTSRGLQAPVFKQRYRCYFMSMLLFLVAVSFNVVALIIYPIKYSEEVERRGGNSWNFGWTYGIGWGASVLLFFSALLLYFDKDADEVVYRETTSYDNTIEEELEPEEGMSAKDIKKAAEEEESTCYTQ